MPSLGLGVSVGRSPALIVKEVNPWVEWLLNQIEDTGQVSNVPAYQIDGMRNWYNILMVWELLNSTPSDHAANGNRYIEAFHPFLGSSITEAMVAAVGANATNFGFVNGNRLANGAIQGDGVSHIDTNVIPAVAIPDKTSAALGYYAMTPIAANNVEMGAASGGHFSIYVFGGALYGEAYSQADSVRASSDGNGDRTGVLIAARTSATELNLYRKAELLDTASGEPIGDLPTSPIAVFGRGANTGANFKSISTIGCSYIFRRSINQSQVSIFTDATQALMDVFGRAI